MISEIEFGNLNFYHNNDRSNNITITTNLPAPPNLGIIVNGNFDSHIELNGINFIEFEFDLNYDMPNFLNSLSYTKLYQNLDIYDAEKIYIPLPSGQIYIPSDSEVITRANNPQVTTFFYTDTIIFENTGDEDVTSYNINFSEDTLCDILIVGGGGSGGFNYGEGGEGGQVIYTEKKLISKGDYLIKVGNGGNVGNGYIGCNGHPSEAFSQVAHGGASGASGVSGATGASGASDNGHDGVQHEMIGYNYYWGGGGGGYGANGGLGGGGGGGGGGKGGVWRITNPDFFTRFSNSNYWGESYDYELGGWTINTNIGWHASRSITTVLTTTSLIHSRASTYNFESMGNTNLEIIITMDKLYRLHKINITGVSYYSVYAPDNDLRGENPKDIKIYGLGEDGWDLISETQGLNNSGGSAPTYGNGFQHNPTICMINNPYGIYYKTIKIIILNNWDPRYQSINIKALEFYETNLSAINFGNGGNGKNGGNGGDYTGGGGGGGAGGWPPGNGGSGIVIISDVNAPPRTPNNSFTNIENTGYADGRYDIGFSTNYNANKYFNDGGAIWLDGAYDDNGEYIGGLTFNNLGYNGDWITIKMPVNIIPTKIRFVSFNSAPEQINRLPKKYRLYGYFNFIWELIIDDYVDDNYIYDGNIAYTKIIKNAKNYNKYAFIVNKIGTGANYLAMSNFEIFGRQIFDDDPNDANYSILLKTELFDQSDNKIEINNTILDSEQLIHGIKNGTMTSYNMTKYDLFDEERLYPPYHKSNILLFNKFFIQNKIYGNGQYEIQYSSYDVHNTPLNIFRNNYYSGKWELDKYRKLIPTSIYSSYTLKNQYLIDDYYGEWITINLPYKILLTKFIIALDDSKNLGENLQITGITNALLTFPNDFKIYGKNNDDGDDEWELIIAFRSDSAQKNIELNNKYDNLYSNDVAFEYKLSDNDRDTKFKLFKNYGLVVSQIQGGTYLKFSKWDIYGRELPRIITNKPDNIPIKKNIKFSHLSQVFDDTFYNNLDNKNINFSHYSDNLLVPPVQLLNMKLSDFKGISTFIDNIPRFESNDIFARYQTNYESLSLTNNILTTWLDTSGHDEHIRNYRGTPFISYFDRGTKGTIGENYFNIIKGDYNSGFILPFKLNNPYTFCYVARYVGDKNNTAYNRRIFDSSTDNTAWGFNNNQSGISHHSINDEVVAHTIINNQHFEPDYWMIGIETKNTARYNGQDCTDYYNYNGKDYPQPEEDGVYDKQLTINYGQNVQDDAIASELTSNWEIAELIFYKGELSTPNKILVEQYLAKKFGHISFSNVVQSLEDYETIIRNLDDLSDMWFYVYDSAKYGYIKTLYKFYGPAGSRFDFVSIEDEQDTPNTKYYWIAEFKNHNSDGQTIYDYNNYAIYYDIQLLDSTLGYDVHMVAVGGGAGGGGVTVGGVGGGGGGGGVAYMINNKQLKGKEINLQIGQKGRPLEFFYVTNTAFWAATRGGSTYIVVDNVRILGVEGGHAPYQNSYGQQKGGSRHSLAWQGGGGEGQRARDGGEGGAISNVLESVDIPGTSLTFHDLLDEFNESWGEYMYTRTAGRQMHQGKGGNLLEYGGHGYAIILLDFDVET